MDFAREVIGLNCSLKKWGNPSMLVENINYLRQHQRHIRDLLQIYEEKKADKIIEVVETRTGKYSLQVTLDNRPQYIHSKYDPQNEAERFIDQFSSVVDNYEHVLFYGVGFGYHIEEFMRRYPNYTFSMYEPSVEIFHEYMNYRMITELPVSRIKEIFLESSRENGQGFLNRLAHNIQERILLIVLPTYERIFSEKYQCFIEDFKKAMASKRQNNYVDMDFGARWTLNSLLNLPTTLQTPNILDGFEQHFRNKPMIIVAAGPSLEDEYENLRYIKENKLAYIFAVGSANRALISQNILPDAVCTYDPQEHNYGVFSTMFEKGIDTVPMIYGTSVGFETIKMYQGPKLHMITSQDTVSPYYIKSQNDSINIIDDAPTIAALTFQLAVKLGCNPIVFVGQNLGFKNNQYYSKDVNYKGEDRKVEVMDKDRQGLLFVEDVYGNQIKTNPSLNSMRENIEWYVSNSPQKEVFNATKGGAAIKGTEFKPLEELISEHFSESCVIENWYKKNQNNYDNTSAYESIKKMSQSMSEFQKQYKEISLLFEDMHNNIKSKKEQKLSKNIVKFDKVMKKLIINDCYQIFIQPVNRLQYQALTIKTANIRKQSSELEKAELIIEAFQPYLDRCKLTLDQLKGSVYKVHELYESRESNYKFYSADCGAFKYQGEWNRKNYGPAERVNYKIYQYVSSKKDSSISFRFTGTTLRLFGSKETVETLKIQLTIDGHSEIVKFNRISGLNFKQPFFEKFNLNNQEHGVEIKLLDENKFFMFYGLEINENDRLLHVDEVTKIEDLEIGKRLRAHYKAIYNTPGIINNFGEDTSPFIQIESATMPNGDFYFVMVDFNKIIADRNIQLNISWDRLQEKGLTTEKGLTLCVGGKQLSQRLITGGTNKKQDDCEWNKFIRYTNLGDNPELFWGLYKNQLEWCLESFAEDDDKKAVIRGYSYLEGENVYDWSKITTRNIIPCGFRPLIVLT